MSISCSPKACIHLICENCQLRLQDTGIMWWQFWTWTMHQMEAWQFWVSCDPERCSPGPCFPILAQGQEFVSASYDNTIRLWDAGQQRSKEALEIELKYIETRIHTDLKANRRKDVKKGDFLEVYVPVSFEMSPLPKSWWLCCLHRRCTMANVCSTLVQQRALGGGLVHLGLEEFRVSLV